DHPAHQLAIAGDELPQQPRKAAITEVRVEVRPGNGQLLDRDAPVQQLPAVLTGQMADTLALVMGIETSHQGLRPDALASGLEPERRPRWNKAQPVPRKLWLGMGDTGRVVPHPAEFDHLASHGLDLRVQLAVGARIGTAED